MSRLLHLCVFFYSDLGYIYSVNSSEIISDSCIYSCDSEWPESKLSSFTEIIL